MRSNPHSARVAALSPATPRASTVRVGPGHRPSSVFFSQHRVGPVRRSPACSLDCTVSGGRP
jgi:hypothetical protein